MSGELVVQGRKKGGGGSESPNTLRSTQIAEVVLLVSEGEAKGLVNGLKSVYLDQVPIQNQDGSFNFEDVSFAYVPGTQAQAPLPGITSLQNEVSVGVTVVQATPVVRSISNPAVDHVRVTIQVPALTDLDLSTGTLNGSWFEFAIDIQSAGGGYVQRHFERVEGKATNLYAKAVRLELTGSAPWDVRVRRVSIDPPSNIQSAFSWSSYTEITSIKLRYPNAAVGVLRVNAKSFQKIPLVALDWLGQLVDVPSNYNPITRVYTGTWNGTFTKAWTSCPPWVLHDLVTHTRYGAGDWVSALVSNKWALYAIGQYCDVMVSDGRGGTEPRFTCNVNLEVRGEALNVIRDLAAVFRGMLFWAGGMVDYAQDAPGDPVHTFTPANVVDGRFSYSDVSEKKQHSVFICWWNDLAQFGKLVPELYVDETLVARYGIKEFEMQPLGLTSRGQAARACRWARHSEQEEGELVTFEVGADGVAVQLGKTFRIADPNEAGERLGGRIRTATTTQVTLDAPVTLASGETYTLTVLQPDPADVTKLVAQTRTVTTAAGTVSVITVGTAFSAAPVAQSVWLLESNAVGATLWRCMGIEEVAGKNRFKITGIAHNPSKYAAIESGLVLDQRKVSRLQLVPPKPTGLAMAENVYRNGQVMRTRATVSWLAPVQGLLYQVAWRYNGGAWTPEPDTSANSIDIAGLGAGTLDVRVRSLNSLGNSSLAETATFTLTGGGALVGADDLVLIARGNCTLLGNQATKSGGTGAWDSDVYSRDSYVGGAFVSAVPGQANRSLMFGLNSDPLTDTDYPSLDFAIYCDGTAALLAYESGVAASLGTYAAGDVLAVVYDGARVRYLKNGAVLRTITVAAGLTLFMDSSFNSPGSVLKNIRFGPLTAGDWSSIYGPNKPSDNATTDLALVARGNCALVGNQATKNGGTSAWDSDVYSLDSFTGGAYASAVPAQTNRDLMFGLNSDPTTDLTFTGLDFALYCEAAGFLLAYESGVGTSLGTYAAGDVLAIVYDGRRVRYIKNGTALRTVTVSTGLKLFFDSSFYGPGGVLKNIRFGPLSQLAELATDQIALGAITDTPRIEVNSDSFALTSPYGVMDRGFTAGVITNSLSNTVTVECTVTGRRRLVTPSGLVGTAGLRCWVGIVNVTDNLLVSSTQDYLPDMILPVGAGQTVEATESTSFAVDIPPGKVFSFTPSARTVINIASTGSGSIQTFGYTMRFAVIKR